MCQQFFIFIFATKGGYQNWSNNWLFDTMELLPPLFYFFYPLKVSTYFFGTLQKKIAEGSPPKV